MALFSLVEPGLVELFISGTIGAFIPIFYEIYHGTYNRFELRIKNNPSISIRKAYTIECSLIAIYVSIGGFIAMVFATTIANAMLIGLGLETFLSKYRLKKFAPKQKRKRK